MSRYFTRPRSLWIEDDVSVDDGLARPWPIVADHEATDTGLVDASGDPIMRAPNPIGYGRDDEW